MSCARCGQGAGASDDPRTRSISVRIDSSMRQPLSTSQTCEALICLFDEGTWHRLAGQKSENIRSFTGIQEGLAHKRSPALRAETLDKL
jgi:hypothetical protein